MAHHISRSLFKINTNTVLNGLHRSFVGQRPSRLLKIPTTKVQRCSFCQKSEGHESGESRNINLSKLRTAGTFHIDTLELSKVLIAEGFTVQQSELLTRIFVDVINSALDHQSRVMVTKPQQEIMVQQLLSQINSVKKDMVILEKSEFTMIKNDTDKQTIVIKNLESKLEDEVKKLKGQILLDINLERGRATEAHSINEKKVTSLEHKIEVEHANIATTLKELEKRIDLGVSNSQTEHEKFKSQFYSGIAASIVTAIGIMLGWYRLVATKPPSTTQQLDKPSTTPPS